LERPALRTPRRDIPVTTSQLDTVMEGPTKSAAVLDILDCSCDIGFDDVIDGGDDDSSLGCFEGSENS